MSCSMPKSCWETSERTRGGVQVSLGGRHAGIRWRLGLLLQIGFEVFRLGITATLFQLLLWLWLLLLCWVCQDSPTSPGIQTCNSTDELRSAYQPDLTIPFDCSAGSVLHALHDISCIRAEVHGPYR